MVEYHWMDIVLWNWALMDPVHFSCLKYYNEGSSLPGAMLRWIPHTSSLVLRWSFQGCRYVQRAWLHFPSVYSCSLFPNCSVSAEASPYYYLITGNFSYLPIQPSFRKPASLPDTPKTDRIRERQDIPVSGRTAQQKLDSLPQHIYVDVDAVCVCVCSSLIQITTKT